MFNVYVFLLDRMTPRAMKTMIMTTIMNRKCQGKMMKQRMMMLSGRMLRWDPYYSNFWQWSSSQWSSSQGRPMKIMQLLREKTHKMKMGQLRTPPVKRKRGRPRKTPTVPLEVIIIDVFNYFILFIMCSSYSGKRGRWYHIKKCWTGFQKSQGQWTLFFIIF